MPVRRSINPATRLTNTVLNRLPVLPYRASRGRPIPAHPIIIQVLHSLTRLCRPDVLRYMMSTPGLTLAECRHVARTRTDGDGMPATPIRDGIEV